MIGTQGEIYSAEDADSAESEGATRKKEGAFYVWTRKEVCLHYLCLCFTAPHSVLYVSQLYWTCPSHYLQIPS